MDLELILDRLNQKKKKLELLKPASSEFYQSIDEWFKIELTYTSNAIEGNTLTRQETAWIVEKGLTIEGKSLKEHLEAISHVKAYEYIKTLISVKRTSLTEKHILNIHSSILDKIDTSNAGCYRTIPVRIAGTTVILPNPMKVPFLMKEFVAWLTQKSSDSIAKLAAEAHFKLVSIHPFTDGNGRTARLLMNLLLMQEGYPPALIKKEERRKYLNTLEEGQTQKNLENYYHFIYSAIENSFDIYFETIEGQNNTAKPQNLLKIGDLAKKTGEASHTIRYWTKEGLLNVAGHTPGGYQLYELSQIQKIKRIRQLQLKERLTIEEIKKRLRSY